MNFTMNKEDVQAFLDALEPLESFDVIFFTNKGERRIYEGHLILGNRLTSDIVAFELVTGGFKSFNVSQVVSIERS